MEKNSFTSLDYNKAKNAFSAWNVSRCADIDDYVMHDRMRELRNLVKKVIKNELSQKDQLLVSLHWYKGKSKQEIAELTGLDRSTVFRRFEKINSIIYEKLKYALEYRYGDEFSSNAMLLIKRDVSSKAKIGGLESIGGRILRLREEQCLSKEEVSNYTAIPLRRLEIIEKRGNEITMLELKKLASFFRVSSDYIIFGSERVLRNEETGEPAVSFS